MAPKVFYDFKFMSSPAKNKRRAANRIAKKSRKVNRSKKNRRT